MVVLRSEITSVPGEYPTCLRAFARSSRSLALALAIFATAPLPPPRSSRSIMTASRSWPRRPSFAPQSKSPPTKNEPVALGWSWLNRPFAMTNDVRHRYSCSGKPIPRFGVVSNSVRREGRFESLEPKGSMVKCRRGLRVWWKPTRLLLDSALGTSIRRQVVVSPVKLVLLS